MSDAEKEIEARLTQLERHLPTIVRLAQAGQDVWDEGVIAAQAEREMVAAHRERVVAHMALMEQLCADSVAASQRLAAAFEALLAS